jgi:putative membrane protein
MILFFVVLGSLSVYPTVTFIRWRNQTGQGLAPIVSPLEFKRLRLFLTLEIVVLLVIVMCASLMAKGVMS